MGAGVATGPHLSRVRTAAPVRAWRLSWAGRTPLEQAPRVFGVPAEVLRPRSVPYEHLSGEPGICPFAVPSAEASGSAGPSKKVGSACASRFFLDGPFHRAGCLRSEDRRPRPRWPRFRTFFPCGKSAPHREAPYCSAFRVAPSGISRLLPVDNEDNVDKWADSAAGRQPAARLSIPVVDLVDEAHLDRAVRGVAGLLVRRVDEGHQRLRAAADAALLAG